VLWNESGSGSRRAKWPRKIKELMKLIFFSAECSLLRAEGFSCGLDVLNGWQGISKLQFLMKKLYLKNFQQYFFNFCSSKPWIRIRFLICISDSLKMLDPDPYPDPDSMNPDPQH
jgi:hypothetical protein